MPSYNTDNFSKILTETLLKLITPSLHPYMDTFGELTHLPLDKMAVILADNIFKCIFLNENDRILIQISLKFVPESPINNNPVLVQVISLCNHVTLYGLASPRLLHSLVGHIKTSHSFKSGCSNGRWVVLYALVSPQWPHAWFCGRVRTILSTATAPCPCVNKFGGSM